MDSVARKRHPALSGLAWGFLILYALASWVLLEIVLMGTTASGCFDGNEPACAATPLTLWGKTLLWGLWIGTGVLSIRNVRALRRAAETTTLHNVTALAAPPATALAFVAASYLLS